MKSFNVYMIGAAALVLGGAALLFSSGGLLKAGAAEKAALGALKAETAVAQDGAQTTLPTAPVEVVDQATVLRLTGALAADEKSEVASNTNGIVQKVFVERGSVVAQGDILVQVDPVDVQNMMNEALSGIQELKIRLNIKDDKTPYSLENQPEVKMAKAALDLARVNLDRYMALYEQNVLAKADYDRVLFECDSAKQRYEQTRLQMQQLHQSYLTAQIKLDTLRKALGDTAIRAPFSGYVAERLINVGERVAPSLMGKGAVVVTLVKLDPLRLILTVPQQNVEQIQTGQTVNFHVDGIADRIFTAEIKYVGPSVESNSRSMTVEALAPNPDHMLRPGMFVSAEAALPVKSKRLLVPAAAVIREGDVAKLFVLRDGVARVQVVATGDAQGDRMEITSGLNGDETVITAPERVHDGDKVS